MWILTNRHSPDIFHHEIGFRLKGHKDMCPQLLGVSGPGGSIRYVKARVYSLSSPVMDDGAKIIKKNEIS